MSNRVYSEQEVARLIRRAVELESKRSDQGPSGSDKGLTIQDLEKIAADAGIDPELMHRAAEEMDHAAFTESFEETTKVNRSEIFAEHWIKADVNNQLLDDLITEMNHRFGTSQDDINWWDRLWNDYSGKAVVNKTASSADWRYTDEMELYTTRVLMQQRGDKLRIRVSKRQGWNLSWNSEGGHLFWGFLSITIFTVIGSVLGFTVLSSPWIGILGGLALSALVIPLTMMFSKRRLNWHKQEVTEIAETLVLQAKRIANELPDQNHVKTGSTSKTHNSGYETIEIESEKDRHTNTGGSSRLKNHLRE